MLVKRHGTVVHQRTADVFAAFVLALICIYSITSSLAPNHRRISKFHNLLKSPFVLIPLWIGVLLFGLFYDIHFEIMQFSRRTGQLSIACCTITTFLSLKPALLPKTYQVGLMPLHKWIGRSAIALAYFHGITYFCKLAFVHESQEKRHAGHQKLSNHLNILGIISLVFMGVLLVSSLKPIRTKMYAIFYLLHWPLVLSMFVMMIWHARPSASLLIACALTIMAIQVFLRLVFSHKSTIVRAEQFGDLKLVEFSPSVITNDVECGSHVRLSGPLINPKSWVMPSHPYTLVGDNKVVVKESRYKLIEGNTVSVFGHFPSSFNFALYDSIILIAGGSGISMAPNFSTLPTNKQLIWITRNQADTQILEHIGIQECDVYITSTGVNTNSGEVNADEFELQDYETVLDNEDVGENANADITEQDGFLEPNGSLETKGGITKRFGRPNFTQATAKFLENENRVNKQVCVVSCGPEELVKSVDKWAKQNRFSHWSEVYGF